ncbi:glycosyltransferase family 4 protein [filamentous cyanobacterium LEGE 11480]|uniref:Glycosyltransferase family 4 protein n=1 Tax=Romeriopsis navalis LEGE 11480 TaxID=2777977 RepID=A0A928VN94_9CYAN|nr:glycosyltransferase family 4 protein [Romeriopsis navalis]MBE9029527.1 glycosyltransferase family 4 protein [Romeriopsis navalis LEGE 11480]
MRPKILFLDQSGKLGGAELSLLDIAIHYDDRCLVALFADGPFQARLATCHIPTRVLTQVPLSIGKQSTAVKSLKALRQIIPLIRRVAQLSQDYDIIYANTPKAFVIGAIASRFSRRPLIYHLRDILSADHFSQTNLKVVITLANCCATKVIANSMATQQAFIQAGGKPQLVEVLYNGFDPAQYQTTNEQQQDIRHTLGWDDRFIIGHFSRLSPWKGQHILLEALARCPDHLCAILVGDALFGETDYVQNLHQQVERLKLHDRVKFLGFRQDIPPLMTACDLITHTSTAPEPFGRVIIEAMLCKTPVIAASGGGAVELIHHNQTGWLTPLSDVSSLADRLCQCATQPSQMAQIVHNAYAHASTKFTLDRLYQQLDARLLATMRKPSKV